MHKGKIISCDTVEHLRRNLQTYDELVVSCETIGSEALEAVRSLLFVAACENTDQTLVIRAANLRDHLIEVLKQLREHGVSIKRVETNEPTLEDIFVGTITGGVR